MVPRRALTRDPDRACAIEPLPWRGVNPTSRRLPDSSVLLFPRLEIALAVIAAFGTPRRAIAVGFSFVTRPRFLAAATLHQHAAALAIGDQAALARRLERLLAARRGGFVERRIFGRLIMDRPVEIRACQPCDLFTELLAQHPGLDFLHRTFSQFGKLER